MVSKILNIKEINKIKEETFLIYRDSSIGDIIACEPIIKKLKFKNRNYKIGWVIKENFIDLLRFHPNIDYIITVKNREEAWSSLKNIRDNIKPILLYMYPRDKKTLEKYGPYLKVDKRITAATYYHYGSLLNSFSKAAGIHVGNVQPHFYIDNSINTPEIVDKNGINVKNYICVHCSSNQDDYGRDWDNNKWKELVDYFGRKKIYTVELGLSPVIQTSSRYYIDMTHENRLQYIAKIIDGSSYFIGIDSGLVHIANALEKDGCCLLGRVRNSFYYHTPFTGMFRYKNILRSPKNYAAFHIKVSDVILFYEKRNNIFFLAKNISKNWIYVNIVQAYIRLKIFLVKTFKAHK